VSLQVTGSNRLALEIIGYVGVSISVICMALTVFVLLFFKYVRMDNHVIESMVM
jgi:hypothetical protein